MVARFHDRRYRFLSLGFVLGLAILPGCSREEISQPVDWDSAVFRNIEAEWQSLRDQYQSGPANDGTKRYDEYRSSVQRLFQTRLSLNQVRQLATSSKLPLRIEDDATFTGDLLAFMARSLIQAGDRDHLVLLLSKRCPSRIEGPETLEYWLAFQGWKLKAPMTVLGDAYERSRVPETRQALAAAVRRSFAGVGIRAKDDAEFIRKALEWYKNEKDHLTVNPEYFRNETSPGGISLTRSYERYPDLYDNPPPEREPLFKIMPRGVPKNLGDEPDR